MRSWLLQRCLSSAHAAAVRMATSATSVGLASQLRQLADRLDALGGHPTPEFAQQLQKLAAEARTAHGVTASGPVQHALQHQAQQQLEAARALPDANTPAVNDSTEDQDQPAEPKSKKQRRGERAFDITKFQRRYVALHVAYVGWQYLGLARQADTDKTIEAQLLEALRRTRLVGEQEDYSDVAYSRCGRTDRGVSALGQVLALQLRSAGRVGQEPVPLSQELDYPTSLNRVLPPDIRVLGWAPVTPEFSARFDARARQYKYYILQDGSLDLGAMRAAAAHLVGVHDFRNFCKADVAQVRNFMRHILEVSLEPTQVAAGDMRVYQLYLRGTAFLWHQVRCIVAVLLMVGRGLEKPEVVQQLLDVGANPCKPQYNMAAEDPLLLYDCEFEGLEWQRSASSIQRNLLGLSGMVQKHLVAAALTHAMYEKVLDYHCKQQQEQQQQQHQVQVKDAAAGGAVASAGAQAAAADAARQWRPSLPPHVPLAQRAREPTMEDRFAKAGISMDLLNVSGAELRAAAAEAVESRNQQQEQQVEKLSSQNQHGSSLELKV